jgi:hypothetical protein
MKLNVDAPADTPYSPGDEFSSTPLHREPGL